MKYLAVVGVVLLAGCAAINPVLAPNARFQRVGREQAQRDVLQCKVLADQMVPPTAAERAAHEAAIAGARAGSTDMTAVNQLPAFTSSPPRSVALGPPRATQGSPAWKDFVSRCLEGRGYEVTGWQ